MQVTVVLVDMEPEARRVTAVVMVLAVLMAETLMVVRQEVTDSTTIHLAVSEDLAHLALEDIRDRMITIRMTRIPGIFRRRRTT